MTRGTVLALPKFSQQFILETNPPEIGVGAVLGENGHPISYFLKKNSTSNVETINIHQIIIGNHRGPSQVQTLLVGKQNNYSNRSIKYEKPDGSIIVDP